MFVYNDSLLMLSEGSLGFVEISEETSEMCWKVERIKNLSTSFSVTAALQDGNNIIIAN